MVMIQIPDDLVKPLQEMARRKNCSLEELVISILRSYCSTEMLDEPEQTPVEGVSALDALMGMFDDDITDISTTVKETMREYYKNKKWKS